MIFSTCHAVRIEPQALVALPEYGSFAGGLVDENVGGLIWSSSWRIFPTSSRLMPVSRRLSRLDSAALVIPHRPDILHPKPPTWRKSPWRLATWPPGLRSSRSKATFPA